MHGKLTEVSTGLTGIVQRVDRIASVLPDMNVRIAQEELSRPVQGAIIVASATKIPSSGQWVASVHVLNADTKTRDTYIVSLKSPEDSLPAIIASGLAVSVDKTAASFETAAKWSIEAKDSSQAPGWVDTTKSFILRAPASDYAKTFESTLTSYFAKVAKHSSPISGSLRSWKEMSIELTTNSAAYFKKDQDT